MPRCLQTLCWVWTHLGLQTGGGHLWGADYTRCTFAGRYTFFIFKDNWNESVWWWSALWTCFWGAGGIDGSPGAAHGRACPPFNVTVHQCVELYIWSFRHISFEFFPTPLLSCCDKSPPKNVWLVFIHFKFILWQCCSLCFSCLICWPCPQ